MPIDANIPLSGVQPANPLDTMGKVLNMKSLMQGQQLKNLEIQQKQLQVQDQQAMTHAMHEWDGQDMNALPTLILKHGGSAQAVMGMKSNILSYQKELAQKNELDLKNEATKADVISGHIANIKSLPEEQQPEAYTGAIHDLVTRGYMTPQEAMQHPYPGPDGLDILEKTYMGHAAQIDQTLKTAQAAHANAQAKLEAAQTPGAQAKSAQDQAATAAQLMSGARDSMSWAAKRQFALSKGIDPNIIPEQFSPQAAQQLQSAALTPEQTVQAQQKGQEIGLGYSRLKEEHRHNIATEAGTPVYGVDPKTGKTVAGSLQDAQAGGWTFTRKVTESQISEDRQLNNRLTDVSTKINRYQDAMNDKGVTAEDRMYIRRIVNDDKFKASVSTPGGELLGGVRAELPVDWVNQMVRTDAYNSLSPAGKKLIASYFNARESMQGYTRVLTGSGRSNEKAMQLNLDALPNPMVDSAYANEAIGQFNENLKIAGRGLPELPGMGNAEPQDFFTKHGGKKH